MLEVGTTAEEVGKMAGVAGTMAGVAGTMAGVVPAAGRKTVVEVGTHESAPVHEELSGIQCWRLA